MKKTNYAFINNKVELFSTLYVLVGLRGKKPLSQPTGGQPVISLTFKLGIRRAQYEKWS